MKSLFQGLNSFLFVVEVLIEVLLLHKHHLGSFVGERVQHLDQLARHVLSLKVKLAGEFLKLED
jgi:hypothetical protein